MVLCEIKNFLKKFVVAYSCDNELNSLNSKIFVLSARNNQYLSYLKIKIKRKKFIVIRIFFKEKIIFYRHPRWLVPCHNLWFRCLFLLQREEKTIHSCAATTFSSAQTKSKCFEFFFVRLTKTGSLLLLSVGYTGSEYIRIG